MKPPQFPAYDETKFYCASRSRTRAVRKGHFLMLCAGRVPLTTFLAFTRPRNGILG